MKEKEETIGETTSPAHFRKSTWECFWAGADPNRMGVRGVMENLIIVAY